MRPESTSITLRRDLSAVAQEYDAERAVTMFIGRRVAPVAEVGEESATYPIFNRESFKKPQETKRASGARYNRITGEFGSGNYTCEEHGLEYPIDDKRRKRYATFLDAEQAAVRILRFQILLAHERRVSALISGGGFTNHNAATVWSTSATAVPIDDILTGAETLEDNCGIPRSEFSLIIPRSDLREMLATTQVSDKVKYTYPGVQPALLQPAQIAAMLGITEVIVAAGSYDSTEEGVAESNTQIWTAGVTYLGLLAREGDPFEAAALARTILWTADSPTLPVIETYRDDPVRSDIVRMRDDTDEVLLCDADLFGYKITT